jgi:hypothetical protein
MNLRRGSCRGSALGVLLFGHFDGGVGNKAESQSLRYDFLVSA